MKAKVRQLISNNSGNPIANQFEIWTDKGKYFQSYNSTIVLQIKKEKYFQMNTIGIIAEQQVNIETNFQESIKKKLKRK